MEILRLHIPASASLTMCIWHLIEPSQSLSNQQFYLMLSIFKESNVFEEHQEVKSLPGQSQDIDYLRTVYKRTP